MSFTTLAEHTLGDAPTLIDNFYHVGQGNRLPMAGASLASVDATYDLGESTSTWLNVFSDKLTIYDSIATADKSLFVLISETTLADTSGSVSFTGLNGDAYETMIITVMAVFRADGNVSLQLNGDGNWNYGNQELIGKDFSVTAIRDDSQGAILINYNDTTPTGSLGLSYSRTVLHSKSGNERIWVGKTLGAGDGSVIDRFISSAGIWNNTSDTVTSLVFLTGGPNSMCTGTTIKLWGRK